MPSVLVSVSSTEVVAWKWSKHPGGVYDERIRPDSGIRWGVGDLPVRGKTAPPPPVCLSRVKE